VFQLTAAGQEQSVAVRELLRALNPGGPRAIDARLMIGLKPGTQRIYWKQLRNFGGWLDVRGYDPKYAYEMDNCLAEYLGTGLVTLATFEHVLAAVERVAPHFKRKLEYSHAVLAQLRRHHPPKHTLPIGWAPMMAVALDLCNQGHKRVAGLLILQRSAGLRPSEALGLEAQHLILPNQNPWGRRRIAVLLLGVRTGTKSGRAQFTTIDAEEYPTAIQIMTRFVSTTPKGVRLTAVGSVSRYSSLIEKASSRQHLARYTAHSPRAGWASAARLSGKPVMDTMEQGRWLSITSMRVYLDAVSILASELGAQSVTPLVNYIQEDFAARFPWWEA